MNELKNNKNIIFVCIMLVIITLIILNIPKKSKDISPSSNIVNETKKYEANTFIPVYVTESDIVNKYLNDYKNLLFSNLEEAYQLLNIDYRNAKFDSYEEFKEYVDDRKSIMFSKMIVDEFTIFNNDGYKFYYVKTNSEDTFIFKEISIMNYEVYLDNYSIEMK